MTNEKRAALTKQLICIGERIQIPCPDGIKGCAVFHFRVVTDPSCQAASDQIEADGKRIAELEAALREFVDAARYNPHMGGTSTFMGWNQSQLRRAETQARAALGEKQ